MGLPSDGNGINCYYTLALHAEPTARLEGDAKSKLSKWSTTSAFPCIQLKWIGVRADLIRSGLGSQAILDALLECEKVLEVTGAFGLILTPDNDEAEAFFNAQDFEAYGEGVTRRMVMPAETIIEKCENYRTVLSSVIEEAGPGTP